MRNPRFGTGSAGYTDRVPDWGELFAITLPLGELIARGTFTFLAPALEG